MVAFLICMLCLGLGFLFWFVSLLLCVGEPSLSFVILILFFSHLNLKFTYEFLLYDGDKNALLTSVSMTLCLF